VTADACVAALVEDFGADGERVIAARLDDVVDDCGITIDNR
jgi:(p)ppGpp synthase/HD superfamily hydrolase